MSEISSNRNGRRWRPATLVVGAAAVALVATACGGGGGNNNASGNGSGSSASGAAKTSCGRNSTDPYPGLKAAEAPSVTANKSDTLPQGTPGKGKPSVKLGSKNFAESDLVGQLYKVALEKKGFTVSYQAKIGPSEIIDTAFKSGKVDAYPEYLGEIATSLAGNPQPKSAKENYNMAKKFEQSKRDATIFKQTPYQDVDIMLVKPDFCKKNKLKSAADLKNVGQAGSDVTFTAQSAARTRFSGFKGLQQAYGLSKANFKGVQAGGQTLKVVESGSANVADGFSTTTAVVDAVKAGKFVALKDPKHIMGFQYVAPVVKQSVAKSEGPAFEKTLNWVDSKLTLDVINQLNKAVQSNHLPAAQVAKKFLGANGLK